MKLDDETRSPELDILAEDTVEETDELPADLIPLPPLPPVEPWTEDEAAPVVAEGVADTVDVVKEEVVEAPEALLPPPLPVEVIVEEEEETLVPEEVVESEEAPSAPLPVDMDIDEASAAKAPAVVVEEKKPEVKAPVSAPAEKPAPKTVTRGQITWIGFVIFLLTLIAAVALSLGILAGINGGLDYASPVEVARVSREVNVLKERADALEQSMAGVQSRLDNLEALSGRVDKLETATGDMQGELETLAAKTEGLNTQVQDLNTVTETLGQQMEEVQTQTGRFQSLMDGLRDLLNTIFPTE